MRITILIASLMFLSFSPNNGNVCYVKVTPEFKAQYEYYKKGVNILKTATDTAGNIVVSCNAMNEFPELFDTMEVNIIWLSPQAFPQEEVDE